MRLACSFPSSLLRHASLLSKTLPPNPISRHAPPRLPLPSSSPRPNPKHLACRPMTAASKPAPAASTRSKKKARREAPENVLRYQLDSCSKRGDLSEALRLYDAARAASVPLSLPHFNALLYLCSSASNTPLGLQRGFEIFDEMPHHAVTPNEATFTSAARLAAAKDDPDLAFDLVKRMSSAGIPPKLRSYGPALLGFCRNGDFESAHEVESHMDASGVAPEEPELAALLRVNANGGRGDDVYRVLHRLRASVRQVSEETAEILEAWFGSEVAAEVGVEEWDAEKVREGVGKGGGGWHGQGWLGIGSWSVGRSEVDGNGVCRRCGERLVCIDIDTKETENFARSLAALACEREAKSDFTGFQEWLERHGPFDAVIDGANVGIYNQRNFSFFQYKLYRGWFLANTDTPYKGHRIAINEKEDGLSVVLGMLCFKFSFCRSRRVRGGPADNPNNKKLLDKWRRSGALYATPAGSNDDWYWLYAAVSCRSFLVTNDEMRDHLFELLGTSFFPRWKEKHQVRLTSSRHGPTFHMPPPYSIVIQESEGGSWHIPTVLGDDIETPRQWVCATRNAAAVSFPQAQLGGMML